MDGWMDDKSFGGFLVVEWRWNGKGKGTRNVGGHCYCDERGCVAASGVFGFNRVRKG